MVLGAFRGWVRIVRGGSRSRASQLIRGVLRTGWTAVWLAVVAAPTLFGADRCTDIGTAVYVNADVRTLYLCENGAEKATHRVALGSGGVGKQQQGDGRLPLGVYSLGVPRASSKFHVFRPIGYPTQEQRQAGYTGGDLGVHGPHRLAQGSFSTLVDWTLGCIAVGTDAEIDSIADWVRKRPVRRILIRAK